MSKIQYKKMDGGWFAAQHPIKEKERLESLLKLRILGTDFDAAFDRITRLAATNLRVPFCLLSFIDQDHQWPKSAYGFEPVKLPRDQTICAHTICHSDPNLILDSHQDSIFQKHPFVKGDPFVRFYAGVPLKTKEGHSVGSLCVFDRTPRSVFSEKEITFLQALSEITMDEVDLHLNRLRLLEEMEKKGRFFAQITHEIRTPMNGILGIANLLSQTNLQVEQRDYMNTILDSSEMLLSTVNELLEYEKLQSDHVHIENKPFEFNHLLNQVVKIFSARALEKDVRLDIKGSTQTPLWHMGDAKKMRQIISNLVSNAIKFTSKGSVTIKLTIATAKKGKTPVRIDVIDTGVGIPDEDQERVFEPYAQLNTAEGSFCSGTGLGLHICQEIAHLIGGKLSLKSKHKKGSTFTLKINLKPTTAPQKNDTHREVYQKFEARILVAEDDRVNQLLIKNSLEKFGIQPEIVQNGQEVLDKLSSESYDLILLDCRMPILDGYETAKKIILSGIGTPLVALTANSFQQNRQKCFDAGMVDFVTKPVSPVELEKILIKWITPLKKPKK